jgi:hypothetical protein
MARSTGDKSYYGLDKIRTDDRMREKYPDPPSSIRPLPFYPTLRRVLRSHGAAVLLVYLEVFHSIDTQVDLHHVQRELQITKRNWWWVASAITTMHLTKANLRAAQITHREFVRDHKGISGLVTPYSLTVSGNGRPQDRGKWELRRNQTILNQLLAKAGITAKQIRLDAAKHKPRAYAKSDVKVTLQALEPQCSPSAVDHANKLSDIIESALRGKQRKSPDKP